MKMFVVGTPRPQARPRTFRQGKFIKTISPITEWRNDVKYKALEKARAGCLKGPLEVTIMYLFKRPDSHYGTGRNAGIVKKSSPHFMTTRPDIDNLNKAVLDAIQDAGLIQDDSAVVKLISSKNYAIDGGTAGALIEIEEIL